MEEHDYDGLSGRRRGKPSSKRVPLQAEKVLQLYREQYFDLNLHHFHEKLGEEQGYTWVELGCKKGPKPGVHRKALVPPTLPGMLLHRDQSRHRWFQGQRWYDLIEVVDDAASETYYARWWRGNRRGR